MCIIRFKKDLSVPKIQTKLDKESFITVRTLPNKCSSILIEVTEDQNLEDLLEKARSVISLSQQPPVSVIIISNEEIIGKIPIFSTPVFILVKNNNVVFFKCPESSILTPITLHQMEQSQYSDKCSIKGKTLRVSYNKITPYFEIDQGGDMDTSMLESTYLDTFLTHHKVKPKFLFANMTWGSRDPVTGKWNGIVQMVNYKTQ